MENRPICSVGASIGSGKEGEPNPIKECDGHVSYREDIGMNACNKHYDLLKSAMDKVSPSSSNNLSVD
jgi:hypothetical protein